MVDQEVPVLIVGGSLVGLSTAVFLGHHGIPSLVLERHAGTAIHPRAAAVTQRTMENYRAVGLEPEIERIAETEFVQNGAIMAVDSLGGEELDWYFRFVNEGVEEISPSRRIFVTQIGLEPALARAAADMGAEVRYGTEARIEAQDADGVTVVVRPREGRPERTVRASYVVAADGAHSPIREQLGIRNLGHGSFSDCITIYFRADVRRLVGDRNLSVVYVLNPRLQGFFRFSIDLQSGFLAVFSTVDEQGERSRRVGEDMSSDTCVAYVRDALGDPGIAVEIESVQRWAATADYAERLREGNVFLAGDSAHVMPPTGGFGGNCGIQDGYDLAWKLAYVLDGRAGHGLLATYDEERQPVGALTTEQAYTRYVLRVDPSLGKDDLMPVVHEVPIELGYRYRSSAIVGAGDDEAMWEDSASLPAVPASGPSRLDHPQRREMLHARSLRPRLRAGHRPKRRALARGGGASGGIARHRRGRLPRRGGDRRADRVAGDALRDRSRRCDARAAGRLRGLACVLIRLRRRAGVPRRARLHPRRRLGRPRGSRLHLLAEVARDQELAIGPELLCVVLEHDLAVGEDVAAVGHLQCQMDVLLDEQHRALPLSGELPDDREQPLDDDGGKAQAELVEQQQLRPPSERARHREHLLLTAREEADTPSLELLQLREILVRERLVGPLAPRGDPEVLGDGQAEEEAASFRHVGDPQARPGARRCPREVAPGKEHASRHRLHEPGDDPKRCGLAGAVGAGEPRPRPTRPGG